jgi:MGT family glycosyltransferase
MGTGLFFNLPAHGHINPTLPLVKELTRRGEHIIYYNLAEFRPKIEASGAEFRPYDFSGKFLNEELDAKRNFIGLASLLLHASEKVTEDFLSDSRAPSPDYILHDSMCPWGKYIASYLQVKAINSTTTFVLNNDTLNQSENITKMVLRMAKDTGWGRTFATVRQKHSLDRKYGCKTDLIDIFRNIEALNLVFTSQYFQPDGDALAETYSFIGPSMAERPDAPPFSLEHMLDQPLIYISLGTLAKEKLEFFRQCIQAFSGSAYNVLMAVGEKIDRAQLGDIPPNIFVESTVPQLKVLEEASLFISHGGMNSVNEALYFGVPLLLVPQQNEQAMVAKRVEQLGAGVIFPEKDISSDILNQVERMLHDAAFSASVQDIRSSFLEAGGYRRGADLILSYIRG